MKKQVFLIFIILVLSACAPTTVPKQKSNLTVGMVKTKIVKEKTTQSELLNLFGAPNLITKNRKNDEVWNYNRMSSDTTGTSFGILKQSAISSVTTSNFDLIITFDKDDIVKDYSVISSSY